MVYGAFLRAPSRCICKRYRGHQPTLKSWDAIIAGVASRRVLKYDPNWAPESFQNGSQHNSNMGSKRLQNYSLEAFGWSLGSLDAQFLSLWRPPGSLFGTMLGSLRAAFWGPKPGSRISQNKVKKNKTYIVEVPGGRN